MVTIKLNLNLVIKDPRIKKEILNGKLKSFYKSKRIIASRGYLEAVTWSFVSSEQASLGNKKENVIIKNPISSDLEYYAFFYFSKFINFN